MKKQIKSMIAVTFAALFLFGSIQMPGSRPIFGNRQDTAIGSEQISPQSEIGFNDTKNY